MPQPPSPRRRPRSGTSCCARARETLIAVTRRPAHRACAPRRRGSPRPAPATCSAGALGALVAQAGRRGDLAAARRDGRLAARPRRPHRGARRRGRRPADRGAGCRARRCPRRWGRRSTPRDAAARPRNTARLGWCACRGEWCCGWCSSSCTSASPCSDGCSPTSRWATCTSSTSPGRTRALNGGGIVGITEPWVYPQLALLPMVLAHGFAWIHGYTVGWAIFVTALQRARLRPAGRARRARADAPPPRGSGWPSSP